jgi:hypothetical protein
MRLRIDLACGQWRVIKCDEWSHDGALTRFIRNGETVLIAPTDYFARVEPLAQPHVKPVQARLNGMGRSSNEHHVTSMVGAEVQHCGDDGRAGV